MSCRLSFILLCICIATSAAAESLEAFLSQKTYEITQGEACSKDGLPASPGRPRGLQCKSSDFSQDVQELSEHMFFDEATKEYLRSAQCWDQKIAALDKDRKEILVKEIKDVLPMILDLQDQIKKLKLARKDYVRGENLSVSDTVRNKKINEKIATFDVRENELTRQLNLILASTYVGGHFQGKKALLEMADRARENPEKYLNELNGGTLDRDLLKPVLQSSGEEQKKFLKAASAGAKISELDQLHFQLSDEQKIQLFQGNELGTALLKGTPDQAKRYANLYCQLDARYGKGREQYNTLKAAVTTTLDVTLTLALPITPYVAAARGLMSLRAATVVSSMASGGKGLYDTYSSLKEACGESDLSGKVVGTCSPPSLSTEDFTKDVSRGSCYLSLALSASNFLSPLAAKSFAKLIALRKPAQEAAAARAAASNVGKSAGKTAERELSSDWKNYSASFQEAVKKNVENSSAVYKNAIENKRPYIKSLESLGYKFHVNGDQVTVDVPSLEQINQKIKAKMQSYVDSGRIKADDVLLPARAFTNEKNEVVLIPFGDPVPEGYKHFMSVAGDGTLSSKDYTRAIREGKFPIGEVANDVRGNAQTVLEHDLAHVTAFMDNPEFMAALKKGYIETGKAGKDLQPQEKMNRVARLTYLSEMFEITTPKQGMALNKFLTDNKVAGVFSQNKFVTPAQVRQALDGKSADELKDMLKTMNDKGFVEPLGGARRDLMTVASEKKGDGLGTGTFFETPHGIAQRALGRIEQRSWVQPKREDYLKAVTEGLTMLHNSKQLDVTTAVREAFKPKIEKSDISYKVFCGSGVFTDETMVFQSYCK
jgi:hypothetical protein